MDIVVHPLPIIEKITDQYELSVNRLILMSFAERIVDLYHKKTNRSPDEQRRYEFDLGIGRQWAITVFVSIRRDELSAQTLGLLSNKVPKKDDSFEPNITVKFGLKMAYILAQLIVVGIEPNGTVLTPRLDRRLNSAYNCCYQWFHELKQIEVQYL